MSFIKCENCGRRGVLLVCEACRRQVCEDCADQERGLCLRCTAGKPVGQRWSTYSPFFIYVGIALTFLGIMIMMMGTVTGIDTVKGGAVILIGPIPIILGSDGLSLVVVMLAAILTLILLFRARMIMSTF